ncbi:MMPL family transporter [Bacillus marinisedimentorum]|uniref:MMPL family transporter n=1 Tax=Bacillus marinisedimentorum TaxID=1821260 RepID=UPI000872F395|nr:MMPL family transporter [Bacillus marinisedimentorum]
MKVLKLIADGIVKYPMKVVTITIVAILLFAVGAQQVEMATGNNTLIEEDTKVYQDNLKLEREFGGESVIVIYEAEQEAELLTPETLQQMKDLEGQLATQDGIYSIVGPHTAVENIARQKAEKYEEGLTEMADGLQEMGEKLGEISTNIEENASSQSGLPDFGSKISEMEKGIGKMVEGQKKLEQGTGKLVNGYSSMGGQLKDVSLKLQQSAVQMENAAAGSQAQKKQAAELNQLGLQLGGMADKMVTAAEKSGQLPGVSRNTINGLEGIEKGLKGQQSQLDEMSEQQAQQQKDLEELADGLAEMGENLVSMSDNLSEMISYSDSMTPAIPEEQATLDQMIYEDDGSLRSMFDEMMIDGQYMTFMIKFTGDATDADKSEVVVFVKDFMEDNPIEGIDTMVSGKPVLDDSIRTEMKKSMQKMMGLSILFMILVLGIVFRVRWRILPLVIILIAVIGTVGLMGWLSVPITMVSMAVFPILIGLGIDYAIQFQSRYTEEMKGEEQ